MNINWPVLKPQPADILLNMFVRKLVIPFTNAHHDQHQHQSKTNLWSHHAPIWPNYKISPI